MEAATSGRTPQELTKEFELREPTIRNWVAQDDRDEGRRTEGLTTHGREELPRLRRENKQLRVQREIPSKAAACFAQETETVVTSG